MGVVQEAGAYSGVCFAPVPAVGVQSGASSSLPVLVVQPLFWSVIIVSYISCHVVLGRLTSLPHLADRDAVWLHTWLLDCRC